MLIKKNLIVNYGDFIEMPEDSESKTGKKTEKPSHRTRSKIGFVVGMIIFAVTIFIALEITGQINFIDYRPP